jgi:hypothetical protein
MRLATGASDDHTQAASPVVSSAMRSTNSGDYRIDSLLTGYKWGTSTLTYSFYAGGTYYGSESSPTQVSDAVKANVRHILNDILSPLINVTFTEVTDTPTSYGLLRYLCSPSASYGYAWVPTGADTNDGTRSDIKGDVVLNPSNDIVGNDFNSRNLSFQSSTGSHGFLALIHETCHALGLKHPFDDSPTLPRAEDNEDNTVMTYTFDGSSAATPMAYDILALQYLYGTNTSTRADDTTYTFTAADNFSPGSGSSGAPTSPFGRMKTMLWDTGGIDTVDLSALTGGYRIDIQPGGWITNTSAYDSVTYSSTYKTTNYGTRIPLEGTTIENVVASPSADTIYLNSVANTVAGYVPSKANGADVIYNADQSDTLDLGLFKKSDVTQSQTGMDLVLALPGAGSVTVKNYYAAAADLRMRILYKAEVSTTITADRTALKVGDVATITFMFGTSTTNFAARHVTVTGGTLSNFAGTGTTYTATFTPTPNFAGNAVVAVAAGSFNDGANAPNVAGSLQLPVDTIAPTLLVTRAGTSNLGIGSTDTITFTLSELSTTFTATDVTVTGGTISGFSGSGTSYTALFTPAAAYNGNATIDVASGAFTDAAGNANSAATPLLIPVGTIAPTPTIGRSRVGTLKMGDTDTITFSLSASATNFTAGDVTVTGGTLSAFTGTGATYTATFTPTTNFMGTATITVAAGSFTNGAGTPNATGSLQLNVDTIAPTVMVARIGSGDLQAGDTDTITFSISEISNTFTATDVTVTGGTISGFSGSGASYTAVFTAAAGYDDTATIAVAAGAFTDAAGNANLASSPLSIPVGIVAPTLTIGRVGSGPLKIGDTDTITFSLSASATNFTAGDVTVTGGTLSDFTGTGGNYTATFTPTPNFTGDATIMVTDGAFTDGFGTPNSAGSLQLPVDTIAPDLVVTKTDNGILKIGATATITFTLSEPSMTFTADDVTVSGGSISGFSGSGTFYTAVFRPAANYNGTASVAVARGAFTDDAGNANLEANPLSILVNTIPVPIVATSPSFGSSAHNARRLGGELRSLKIVFSVPVTGFTLSTIRLRVNGRSLSLMGARIVGRGTNYTLVLPRGRTAPRGEYVLEIMSRKIVSDHAQMTLVSRIYWKNQPRR